MNSMRASALTLALALVPALVVGCGGEDRPEGEPRGQPSGPTLSAFELEHGIGPVTSVVELGPLDGQGGPGRRSSSSSTARPATCSTSASSGPPLGNVLAHRSPAFVMNIILNPEQMVREHPEGQKLLAEYPLVMPFQNISEDEARAIVEYLRTVMEQTP
jgi:cytochrome c